MRLKCCTDVTLCGHEDQKVSQTMYIRYDEEVKFSQTADSPRPNSVILEHVWEVPLAAIAAVTSQLIQWNTNYDC